MLRCRLSASSIRSISRTQRRGLVSSVLLTKEWESRTVADLRKEAQKRGLNAKGIKSALIQRLQDHDKQLTLNAVTPRETTVSSPATGIRNASTAPVSVSPGIPPSKQPDVGVPKAFGGFMNLPDISGPDPEPEIQIPYYPDFWDSEAKKSALAAAQEQPELPGLPKIVVVGGSATHHGGGPSHHLSNEHEAAAHLLEEASATASGVLMGFNLPASLSFAEWSKAAKEAIPDVTLGGEEHKSQSRPLNGEEKNGVYVLLGLVAGGWLAGGLFGPAKHVDESH